MRRALLLTFLAALAILPGEGLFAQIETTLYQIPFSARPTSILQASDGNGYGTAGNGAIFGSCGTIFQLAVSGTLRDVYTFNCASDGAGPASLIEGPDGALYGVAYSGGGVPSCASFGGCGTIFRWSLSGVFSVVYRFTGGNDSGNPVMLLLGDDGNFYGTTAETIFKFNPEMDVLTTLSESGPSASILQGTDGSFYGTTPYGGQEVTKSCTGSGCGTVFRFNPSGGLTELYEFTGNGDGSNPASLIESRDGMFYGVTTAFLNDYDSQQEGTIFTLTPAGNFSTLYTYSANYLADGAQPGSLLAASDGNIYGSTAYGGASCRAGIGIGTVFRLTNGEPSVIYDFPCDGYASPMALSVQGSDGAVYGLAGGSATSAFRLKPSADIAAPIHISVHPSQVVVGPTLEANFQVLNAFSLTAQQCYAYASLNGGVSSPYGKVRGTYVNGIFSGSVTFTPTAPGDYLLALTCGGTESGFANLTVTDAVSQGSYAANRERQ